MRLCPLKIRAGQARLIAKPHQAYTHIRRVQTNLGALQEPPWLQQSVQENKLGPG